MRLPAYLTWQWVAVRVAYVVLFITGFMIIVQIVYPSSMALPGTMIGGKKYGYQNRLRITQSINGLNDQKLHFQAGDQTLEHSPKELGMTIDGAPDADAVLHYSLSERLIPFSLFFEQRVDEHISYRVDEGQARAFAVRLSAYNKAPKNAVVKLKRGEVVVRPGQRGYVYDAAAVVEVIHNAQLTHVLNISLNPTVADPEISDSMAAEAAALLNQRLSVPLKVEVAGKSITFDKKALASWTILKFDKRSRVFRIDYDSKKVKRALAGLAQQVHIPAIPGATTVRDGRTVGSSSSKPGRSLDVEASAKVVIAAARDNKPQAEARVVTTTSYSRVIRTYSRSSRGMQALLDYWSQSHGGQWGIVMQQLNGGSISASVNPNRQFRSASVYKIFVAYVVYTKINAGQLSMSAGTDTGKSVGTCLELMIVRSDNACGTALGNKIGWSANHGMLRAKGFGSTQLVYGGHLTTARDTATFLTYLQSRSLTGSGYDGSLLSMFGRQIWRYGIPAGSPGMHVANKLGTAGGFNNDIAIVYHPRGTYILTVLTYGSNFGSIRELAGQVAALMSQ
ncbi:MAG TPA: serine hydrolase [Candidatus Limnocylindria bacterium]|nr:serine hydrolase [Candidatus Limnocylindria bacterium]